MKMINEITLPFEDFEERVIVSGGRNNVLGSGSSPEKRFDLSQFRRKRLIKDPEGFEKFLEKEEAFSNYWLNRDMPFFRSARIFYARRAYPNIDVFRRYSGGFGQQYIEEAYSRDHAFKMAVSDFVRDRINEGLQTGEPFILEDSLSFLYSAMEDERFEERFKKHKVEGEERYCDGKCHYHIASMKEQEKNAWGESFLVLDTESRGRWFDYIEPYFFGEYKFSPKPEDDEPPFLCITPIGDTYVRYLSSGNM